MLRVLQTTRHTMFALLFLVIFLEIGCAVRTQPLPQVVSLGTSAAQSDVTEGKTATPTLIRLATETSTETIKETSTPTETPTPLLIPLAQITLPAKSPTPTVTPALLPSQLKGKIAFKSDRLGGEDIFVMDSDGSNVALLTNRWAYQNALEKDTRSPDGNRVAFVREVEEPFAHQIFYVDFNTKKEYQITNVTKGGAAWDPAWSPKGDKIAFTSNFVKGDNVFVINVDGTGLVRLAYNAQEWDHHPSWSPDGNQIVFGSNRTGWQQIWIMKSDGTNLRDISPWHDWNDWDPVWIKW